MVNLKAKTTRMPPQSTRYVPLDPPAGPFLRSNPRDDWSAQVVLLLLVVLCNGIAGCVGRIPTAQKRDAAYLMGQKSTYQKKWELVETFDPYQGGTLIPAEADNPTHLMLFQDGDFIEYDRRNYSSGHWSLDREADRMALTYQMQNNRSIPPPERDTLYRYQVQHHSPDSLVLGVQGRHGIVQLRYRDEATD
jgi:hypothetical protein